MWFAYVLTILFVVTGVFWALDKAVFAPKRQKAADAIRAQMKGGYGDAVHAALARPLWLEYTAGLFGVVAFVFILRSFLYEPFRIPSGSMLPTLYVGDFILVNKYAYGVRLPIGNQVVIPVGTPQRGDIMVFQYPINKSQHYIKRVIGLPNDVVRYENKKLTVNGKVYEQQAKSEVIPLAEYTVMKSELGVETIRPTKKFTEMGELKHDILTIDGSPSIAMGNMILRSSPNPACTYAADGAWFECKVPQGQYFMLGDNRDASEDSRYWGFVPDENVVGRASAIWLHWNNIPSPSGLSFSRFQSLEGK
jgi:signal peptidase I